MNSVWKKVERGIRYREHPARKYGVPRRFDRYYVIRIAVDGVMRQEALGWESEGITLDKARLELAKLREAKRSGIGPRSLSEKRKLAEDKRKVEEEARITVADFWENNYRPDFSPKMLPLQHTSVTLGGILTDGDLARLSLH